MSDGSGRARARERVARRLLERLDQASPDLRGAALFDAAGVQLVASDGADWTARAKALWRAADGERAGGTQLHVGTELGEVFAVRDARASIVATSERFALASLMLSDLRALLRELENEVAA